MEDPSRRFETIHDEADEALLSLLEKLLFGQLYPESSYRVPRGAPVYPTK